MHGTPLKRYTTNCVCGGNWWLEDSGKKDTEFSQHILLNLLIAESYVCVVYSKLITFIFNSFSLVELTYSKLYIFKLNNLMF